MGIIQDIIRHARGTAFIPFVFKYSVKVSNSTDAEFQNSGVRALSLFKAMKFFGYDGAICEVDPCVSFEATSMMGEKELSTDEMSNIGAIRSSVETCAKLSQIMEKNKQELLATIYGETFLKRKYSKETNDHYVLADNLTNLARLYLDAGCTCVVVKEDELTEEALSSCRSIANLASVYSASSVLCVTNLGEDFQASLDDSGFTFVCPTRSGSRAKTRCNVVDSKSEMTFEREVLQAFRDGDSVPTLVLSTGIALGFPPQLLKKTVLGAKELRHD